MATQLFLLNVAADTHRGTNTAKRDGTASGWNAKALSISRGSAAIAHVSNTVLGPTNGIEAGQLTGLPFEFISPPVSADVTISGTITANIWSAENSMSDNVAINIIIDIIRATTSGADASNTIQNIVQSTRVTEVATTTNAVNNFTTGMTSGAYTGQTLSRGDRLRIRVVGDDVGTMAAGGSFSLGYSGPTASVDGDTYVTFTENFSFESAPAGSVLYLTQTVSDVETASNDKEMWTSRGSSFASVPTNTAAGWTAPIHTTHSAGGTVADWFTKQLTAFTLTGMAIVNLTAIESNVSANVSVRCELARVDSDGTNATVWASWCIAPTGTDNGELTTSVVARTCYLSGDDLAFTNGQRIRLRFYLDDISSAAMATAYTGSVYFNSATPATTGDTYITLPVSVTEYSPGGGAPGPASSRRQRRASRYLTFR